LKQVHCKAKGKGAIQKRGEFQSLGILVLPIWTRTFGGRGKKGGSRAENKREEGGFK